MLIPYPLAKVNFDKKKNEQALMVCLGGPKSKTKKTNICKS